MALILLRHTEPVGHRGLCYGRMELDLTESFPADAVRISEELPEIKAILSSPLTRALRLAEALAEARGLSVQVEPRLIEMHFGDWEGQNWSDVPRAELDAWAEDIETYRPPGGETVAEMAARVAAVLDAAPPGTLLVAHAGIAKAAMAWAGAADPWDYRLDFGAWVTLPEPYRS